MNEKFWHLKSCSLFQRLTSDEAAGLERQSRTREFKRGELIYLPADASDSVLLLISGRVKLYHITSEGKQAVLALIDPGELFGELAIFAGSQRDEFAEAMERSQVVLIPATALEQLMQRHSDVSLGVTKLMGLRRRRIEQRLKSLLFRSNRDRLVHLLLELADKYGRSTSEGLLIDIKLSHQDLASIIGSTRETVTVLLGELQAERRLVIKRRQVLLTRYRELADGADYRPIEVPPEPVPGGPVLEQSQT